MGKFCLTKKLVGLAPAYNTLVYSIESRPFYQYLNSIQDMTISQKTQITNTCTLSHKHF